MTAEQIADLLVLHPGTVLVPVSVDLVPEALVEWVECDRFRITPRPDGLHDLHVERTPRLALRWTCASCGWTTTLDAPGFAGDGRWHYPDGENRCGPITAQREIARAAGLSGFHTSTETRIACPVHGEAA